MSLLLTLHDLCLMFSIEDSVTRWEFFQKHQWVSPEFSDSPVFQSWQRCIRQVSAYNWSKPHIASGYTLASLKRRSERVINCAATVTEDTCDLLRDEKLLLMVSDDNGCIMFTIGHQEIESEMAALGIKTGCFLSEDKIGTNAVSFTIDTNMPCEVFAAEHFKRDLHSFAAAAAPIIDNFGKLRGTISLVKRAEEYRRENLVIVSSCAREVSLQLHIQSEQESMNRLQSAHSAALEYMDDGIISWDEESQITHTSHQAEKLLNVNGNDLLDRDIFSVIRFAPNIANCIKQGEMVRRKQTTFEVNGDFIEAIITYRGLADGTNLLFIHPIDKILELAQQQNTGGVRNTFDSLPFVSQKMTHVLTIARRAIKSGAPILITGEQGAGKTELAMAIHNESDYQNGPFITVNCRSTSPDQLFRDVLGFDEGKGQVSRFELAHGGTLYVENIEHLGTELQASILKLIKTGLVSRSDSHRQIPVRLQLITSTTSNISECVSKGSFDSQLYYEISADELHIPPLRHRKEDIEHMIRKLVTIYEKRHSVSIVMDKQVMEVLLNFNWPGNYSQLRNFIEKTLLNRNSNTIELDDIPEKIRLYSKKDSQSTPQIMTLEEIEKQAIIESWKICGGRMQDMAKALNIGRTTLWRKIKKYELTDIFEFS